MRVEVKAAGVNWNTGSKSRPGKTTIVESNKYNSASMNVVPSDRSDRFEHPVWIELSSTTQKGTGFDGGTPRVTDRDARVEFTVDEVVELVNKVVEAGLVSMPWDEEAKSIERTIQRALLKLRKLQRVRSH